MVENDQVGCDHLCLHAILVDDACSPTGDIVFIKLVNP
jgi:hypothetical protein